MNFEHSFYSSSVDITYTALRSPTLPAPDQHRAKDSPRSSDIIIKDAAKDALASQQQPREPCKTPKSSNANEMKGSPHSLAEQSKVREMSERAKNLEQATKLIANARYNFEMMEQGIALQSQERSPDSSISQKKKLTIDITDIPPPSPAATRNTLSTSPIPLDKFNDGLRAINPRSELINSYSKCSTKRRKLDKMLSLYPISMNLKFNENHTIYTTDIPSPSPEATRTKGDIQKSAQSGCIIS